MSKEELIQNIKGCGQALIDNAENIANNYKHMSDLTITCYPAEMDTEPYINVSIDFTPEKCVERYIKL